MRLSWPRLLFALFGGAGTGVDFLIFNVLILVGANVYLANFAGLAAGSLLAFLLNLRFTFSGTRTVPALAWLTFFGLSFLSGILTSAFFWLAGPMLESNFVLKNLLKLLGVTIAFFLKMVLSERLVFGSPK